jgi:hypothetical protein
MQVENMNWGLIHADFDTRDWDNTKKYYGMGQFSKFIPQGSNFIGDNSGITLAAYDQANEKVYVIYRNPNSSSEQLSINLSQFSAVNGPATPYVTSASENIVQKADLSVVNKTLNIIS